MTNVDKLTDTLIHIEHVLEKNIPKGYHEIVQEYMGQESITAIACAIVIIAIVILTIFVVKEYSSLSPKTREDYDLFFCIYIIIAVAFIFGFGAGLTTALQHIVAPNWYILQQLLHK